MAKSRLHIANRMPKSLSIDQSNNSENLRLKITYHENTPVRPFLEKLLCRVGGEVKHWNFVSDKVYKGQISTVKR